MWVIPFPVLVLLGCVMKLAEYDPTSEQHLSLVLVSGFLP